MKTDYEQLNATTKFFDDVIEKMNKVSYLFEKAISMASSVSDSSYYSSLVSIKNRYIPLIDEVNDVNGLISNTVEMIMILGGYNGDGFANLSNSFKIDSNGYFYLKNGIVSLGNLEKTLSVNPDAEANILYIYSYMINNLGYTHNGAMAMLNNMGAESSFDPNAVNKYSGAYGLCQWLDRKGDLIEFANENGLDYTTIDAQLLFMDHELKTRYNSGNEQHRLYDQVTGVLDVSGEWISGNVTKIYEAPVDPSNPDYVNLNQQVASNRYYSYNSTLNDFINANNVVNRDVSEVVANSNTSSKNVYLDNVTTEDVSTDVPSFDDDFDILDVDYIPKAEDVSEVVDNNSYVDSTVIEDIEIPKVNTYVIKSGDSLDTIAKANGTTWQELYEKNRDVISNPNNIYPGQEIKL